MSDNKETKQAPAVEPEVPAIKTPDVILTGAQLLEALDFIAPDRSAEQLESEVAIQYGEGHSGKAHYVWCAEYPEEGSFVLDGSSARASEAAAGEPIYQARQHSDEEGTWDDVQEATYLVCAAEPRFYKTRIVYAAPQPAAPSAAAHAPGCGDGEDCNACDAMNVAAAPQPASEPKIVSLYSTGGTTGYSDYLMTDGSVKTLKVSKIKSADWAQPVSEQQGPKQDDEVEFAARQYEGVPLEVARGLARAAIDASNDERQAVRGLSDEIHARLSNPLTAYGMLVRSLRIVAGTTLYDMAKALLTTPAKLSSMELGRSEVTPEFAFDVAAYFDALGVAGTLPAIQAAILAAKGDGHADK